MATYNVVPGGQPSGKPSAKSSGGGGARHLGTALGWLLALGVLFLIIARPLVTVGAGRRAVVFSLSGGTLPKQLNEGTHFVVPFVQQVVPYDVRTQTYTMARAQTEANAQAGTDDDSIRARTSDGQELEIDISVRYHLDPNNIYRLHQRLKGEYVAKSIRPNSDTITRSVIAEYKSTDAYSAKREDIERRVADRLRTALAVDNIILDEMLLRDVRFSEQFAQSIERKQIAQQSNQRKEYELQRELKIKQQKILEARGDASSIQLRGKAIAQGSRVVQYEYARKIAPNVSAIITDGRNISVPFSVPNAPRR